MINLLSMGKMPRVKINLNQKLFRSKNYNYTLDLRSGYFKRWASKVEEQPRFAKFGPERLTVEISKGSGCPMRCSYCHKGNDNGHIKPAQQMSFETFKKILEKFPHKADRNDDNNKLFFLNYINLDITSVNENQDLFKMMDYSLGVGIIPTIVINGKDKISDTKLKMLVEYCSEIGVSINSDNAYEGYSLIETLISFGARKVNIHYVISNETYEYVYLILNEIQNNPQLKGLDSIIFSILKPVKRGSFYNLISFEDYKNIIQYCLDNHINFKSETCGTPFVEEILSKIDLNNKQIKKLKSNLNRCEAGLFEGYIDCNGKYWQCSFGEDDEMAFGIDVLNTDKTFMESVWKSVDMEEWRLALDLFCRKCPLFTLKHE